MRSLYEAIMDSDDQIAQKAEDVLTIHRIVEKLIKVFGKRLTTLKIWNGYTITFQEFPVHLARYDYSSRKSTLVTSTSDDAPLKDIYDKYNPMIDRFKRELSKLKEVAKISDTEELEDAPTKSTNLRESIRTLRVEFNKESCYSKFDIEFITCFAVMKGKHELKNPSNLFIEMYARVYCYEDGAAEQFFELIERLKK